MKTDNLIIIKGGAYTDLKRALERWVDLYSKNLQDGLTFKLFKNGRGNHVIQADARLDNDHFYYLINYLKYPEGIEYQIDIEGFTTGKDKNQLQGKELLVYISPTDEEYDTVFVTTSENENFKVDFGGNITEGREQKTYVYPANLKIGLPEIITVQNKQALNKQAKRPIDKLEKRFKLIFALFLLAFALIFSFFRTKDNFLILNDLLAFSVWGWLIFDYQILRVNKLYLSAVGLGLMVFFYGLFLYKNFGDSSPISLAVTSMPILLLIIQRPLRLAFIKVMEREPVIEKPAPSFADFIYFFILWISPSIPVIYFV